MKYGHGFFATALSSLLLVFAGCSTTLVENQPTGASTRCDNEWPGRWQGLSPDDGSEQPGWIEINNDCTRLTSVEGTEKKTEALSLTLVTRPTGQYLVLENPGKPQCTGPGDRWCGVMLMRYVRDGDLLRIHAMDHARVHAAIAADPALGMTLQSNLPESSIPATPPSTAPDSTANPIASADPKQDQANQTPPTWQNFLTGDPQHIAAVLDEHPDFFDAKPAVVLRRMPPTGDATR